MKKTDKKTIKKEVKNDKISPKAEVKKIEKKVVKLVTKKSIKKTPIKHKKTKTPSTVQSAVADIKKLYRKLESINSAKVALLSEIARKETEICEKFDYCAAKIQDRHDCETLKNNTLVAQPITPTIDKLMLSPIVTGDPKIIDPMKDSGLNAVAVKY